MSLFSLRNVTFRYPSQKDDALCDINLEVEHGEFLAILGGDGSGKSTLVRLFNGLIPHSTKGKFTGDVLFEDRSVRELSTNELVRKVGIALQDPENQIFMDSIEEELAFGPENLGMPVPEIETKIKSALSMMGIEDLRTKSPKAISGGQKQRLVIASILAMGTNTIVLDEPLSMLDPAVKKELLITLRKMCSDKGMTIIITSQDAEDVFQYCDRVAILYRGRLISVGKTRDIILGTEKLTQYGIEPPQLLQLYERLMAAEKTEQAVDVLNYFSSRLYSPIGRDAH